MSSAQHMLNPQETMSNTSSIVTTQVLISTLMNHTNMTRCHCQQSLVPASVSTVTSHVKHSAGAPNCKTLHHSSFPTASGYSLP